MRTLKSLLIPVCLITLSACSTNSKNQSALLNVENSKPFSGSIILSRQLPEKNVGLIAGDEDLMAPMIGFIPPTAEFAPAVNEAWLEINKSKNLITVFEGERELKAFSAKGKIKLEKGNHSLQYKAENPTWYADDNYFQNRGLAIPASDSSQRFLKGALGGFALYPDGAEPIHAGAIWSEEVGGLKLSKADAEALYNALTIGCSIVVK